MRNPGCFFALLLAAAATPAAAETQYIQNGDFTNLTNGLGNITKYGSDHITTAVGWTTWGYNLVMTRADQAVPSNQDGAPFSLWDATNGGSSIWNGLAATGTSGNFLALDGDHNTAWAWQSVAGLEVGARYTLTFNYAFAQQYGYDGPTEQVLQVYLGTPSTPMSPNGPPPSGYAATWTSASENLGNHSFSGWNSESLTFTATSATDQMVAFLAEGSPAIPPFTLISDVSLTGGAPEPSTWAMLLFGFAGLGYAGFRSARRRAVT